MAFIDRRTNAEVYSNGSSKLAIGLTEAQAQAIATNAGFDAAAVSAFTAGWYSLSKLVGGNLGENEQSEEIYDEAGDFSKRTRSRKQKTISNAAQQATPWVHAALEYLKDNPVPGRYPLPTNTTGTSIWRFFPALRCASIGQESTSEGLRTLPFELVADGVDGSAPMIGPVELPDDTTDAAWVAPYDDYIDTVFAPA